MKSKNSTLTFFGFSVQTGRNSYKPYYFTGILASIFVLISLISFATEVKKNTCHLNNCNASIKQLAAFPLTGPESIRTNLYIVDPGNVTKLADGVLTEYKNSYHDIVTFEDAYKFTNLSENLGLLRYGSVLTLERRPIIGQMDTLFFKLWKTIRRDYQFEFITINLDHPGMQGFLEDAYLRTRTMLALNGTTKINFSINADAASANVNRFRIIFQTSFTPIVLPVTFTSVKGYQAGNKISIDWAVGNEINTDKYEVERSTNGLDFTMISSITASGLTKAYNSYSWTDNSPVNGNNFYRIKSVDRDGSKKFSIIVKVTTGKSGSGSITIYPNPIKTNMLNLQFTNQPIGIYYVRMINNNGQLVYSGQLPVNSNNISQTIFLNKKLAVGIYQLEIKAPDNTVHIQRAIVEE